jgi:hypothetical protein
MLSKKLQETAGTSAGPTLYVDDVFSTYLYTGNGSTQTITNGINLAGKGGLTWFKDRTTAQSHVLIDSVRGTNKALFSNEARAQSTESWSVTYDANGMTLPGTAANPINGIVNANGSVMASWTFRKAPKFFDVVTYTGNGVAGRQIAHSLGIAPGMIIVKRTDTSGWDWAVYHKNVSSNGDYLKLNTTDSVITPTPTTAIWSAQPTTTDFSVGYTGHVNASGSTYVAYLYAHDTAADGMIQCGSFPTDGSGNATVTLGWETQFLLTKCSSTIGTWDIQDTQRGLLAYSSGNGVRLQAQSGAAEDAFSQQDINSTGFRASGKAASSTYIYMAIRRPNKPPTSGTQVYNAIARTGTGAAATVTGVGFAPDLVMPLAKSVSNRYVFDRLRGNSRGIKLADIQAEADLTATALLSFLQDGFSCSTDDFNICNTATTPFVNYFFKRAPGFFDEVCYTGNGTILTVSHNLTVAPELMIVKKRSGAQDWEVYSVTLGNNYALRLHQADGIDTLGTFPYWDNTSPTTTTFVVSNTGNPGILNSSGGTFVAYLFATLAGISKVGSYTGNGSSQNIECGFAAGARFILIKRTSAAGDWYVWDTARGIVAGNDPHLSLNTTAAEVTTDDSVDPYSAGFAVNQVAATNINVASATYIFLAIS